MSTSATWVKHPGFYINEELDARGWLQRDLAFIIGCAEQSINLIVAGKRSITAEMAKALGDAFEIEPETFMNLQKRYDMAHAENRYVGIPERRRMQSQYPVRAMIQRGWIQETNDVAMLEEQLVQFFGVNSPDEIPHMSHAAKKTSYEEVPSAQLAWLFRVRHIAKSISVPQYSAAAFKEALAQLEELLMEPEQTREVPRILMNCGVRYILVEKLPNAAIDGVTFWLDKHSPVIGMSLQHDRIDNFWFVLRHEIEHVLQRHGIGSEKGMIDLDLEKEDATGTEEEERIANTAARNFCAPSERVDYFIRRKKPFFYQKDVIAFARVIDRHPGLVIGQMRRKLGRYDYLTKYLYSFKIRPFVLPGAIADGWGQVSTVS